MATDPLAADELEAGYRIERFAEHDEVTAEAILDLWRRENVIPDEVARRRVHQVHLVALHSGDGLVGVSSTYLRQSSQLGLELWYYRAFVSRAHRKSNVAVNLAVTGRDVLQGDFAAGRDTRGRGVVYEVEHEGLKTYFNEALWLPTGFTFIGENRKGDHVRVRYFPGALAPEPPR